MKKQTVVIAAIAVLLVVVSCFGVYLKNSWEKNSQGAGNIRVFECVSSDIAAYSTERGKESAYRLVKKDGEWTVENNSVAVIDNKKADELIRYASGISAIKTVSAEELKGYDKTEPIIVRIETFDKRECTLDFFAEKDDECVFKVVGDETNYVMYSSGRDILAAALDSLRKTDIFAAADKTEDFLDFYEFTDYDKSRMCVRVKNGDEISAEDKNRYIMTEPYLHSVDDDKFEQQIAVHIPAVKIAKFVDDFPKDIAKYGLDENSRAVLRFGKGDAENTLYLGRNDGGTVYAMLGGADGVFAVSSAQLEFLHTEPFYIIEGSFLGANLEKVNRITVETKNRSYDIKRADADGGRKYFINGKDTDEKAFEECVKSVGEMNILSELEKAPENTADIKICVYYDDSAAREIELAAAGGKNYAAFVDGNAEFAVDKAAADAIIEKLADLADEPLKLNRKGE